VAILLRSRRQVNLETRPDAGVELSPAGRALPRHCRPAHEATGRRFPPRASCASAADRTRASVYFAGIDDREGRGRMEEADPACDFH